MNFQTEHYEFYLYKHEPYFFSWYNWDFFDCFMFVHDEIIDIIIRKERLKKNSLYAVDLCIDFNPDNPEDWYKFQYKITELTQAEALVELPRIATEVRNLESPDCEMLADDLEELIKLIRHKKIKTQTLTKRESSYFKVVTKNIIEQDEYGDEGEDYD